MLSCLIAKCQVVILLDESGIILICTVILRVKASGIVLPKNSGPPGLIIWAKMIGII